MEIAKTFFGESAAVFSAAGRYRRAAAIAYLSILREFVQRIRDYQ
jgi:hypothetical protein